MMVLGHWKCSGGYRVLIGSPEGVSGTPSNPMGHMGLVKEHTSPQGIGAPYKAIGGGEGKGERERKVWIRISTSFPHPPLSFPFMHLRKGGRPGGPQVGFLLLGAPRWLPLLPSNLYICGAPLEHTTSIVSRV